MVWKKFRKTYSEQKTRAEVHHTLLDYEFRSRTQFICAWIVINFGPNKVAGYINQSIDAGSTIVHILIVEVFVILPCSFIINLIGHYTQSSVVSIGWVCPIVTGITYSMMVITLVDALVGMMFLKILLVYIIYVFTQASQPLQKCSSYYDLNCVDVRDSQQRLDTSVIKPENIPSYIFYESILMGRGTLNAKDSILRIVTSLLYTIITFLIPVLFYYMDHISFKRIAKLFLPLGIFLVAFSAIQITFMSHLTGAKEGMLTLFAGVGELNKYLDAQVWLNTLKFRLSAYDAARVYHINFASMLRPTVNTEQVSIELWATMLLSDFLRSVYYKLYEGIVFPGTAYKPHRIFKLISLDLIAVIFPAGIDRVYTGDTITIALFYTSLAVTWSVTTYMNIQMTFACLTTLVPVSAQYRKYIIATFLFFAFLCSFFVFTREEFEYNIIWLQRSFIIPSWFYITAFITFTLWIYGVNNLCDDFHFKLGYPASLFWRLTLWPIPLLMFMALLVAVEFEIIIISETFANISVRNKVLYCVGTLLFTMPFLISFCYEIIHYVSNKRLMALIKIQEKWGDPDPEVRAERRKYPPRLETKFRRRFEYCKHQCLRYNKLLVSVNEKEYNTRVALLDVPQELIQEKEYIYTVVKRFAPDKQAHEK